MVKLLVIASDPNKGEIVHVAENSASMGRMCDYEEFRKTHSAAEWDDRFIIIQCDDMTLEEAQDLMSPVIGNVGMTEPDPDIPGAVISIEYPKYACKGKVDVSDDPTGNPNKLERRTQGLGRDTLRIIKKIKRSKADILSLTEQRV